MMATRSMVVAGMTAAAVAGLAAPAFAAPAEPGKQPVTPQQCTASNGKVQRADDGVGTCVGGSKYDGHIISDVSTTRQQPGTSGASGTATAPPSGYAQPGYAQPGYAQPAPQYGQAPGYYTGPGGTFYTAPPPQQQPAAPAPQRSAPAQTSPSSSSQDQENSTDEATDSGDDAGN